LEHTFLWTVDAENSNSVEQFMIESQWALFNALRIVPLRRYQNVVEGLKKVDPIYKETVIPKRTSIRRKNI
jgi:hypothetical protein